MAKGETCCEKCSTHFRKPFIYILSVFQIGICIAIINLVYWHLFDLEVFTPDSTNPGTFKITTYECALTTPGNGGDTCTYTWIAAGVSIAVSLILTFSTCFSCACWAYFDIWVDWVLASIATLWWIAASIVLTARVSDAKDNNSVQDSYRTAVVVMSWILALLFFFQYVLSQFRLCYKVCGCCGGKAYKKRLAEEKAAKEAEKKAAKEAAKLGPNVAPTQLPPPMVAPAPIPAAAVAVPVAAGTAVATTAAVTAGADKPGKAENSGGADNPFEVNKGDVEAGVPATSPPSEGAKKSFFASFMSGTKKSSVTAPPAPAVAADKP